MSFIFPITLAKLFMFFERARKISLNLDDLGFGYPIAISSANARCVCAVASTLKFGRTALGHV